MDYTQEFDDNVQEQPADSQSETYRTIQLTGMYENWFLDYASYVILERAVPEVNDGLKPVQRRILHAMRNLDDGRFNKVANIIGNTMQYHPHGDASIGDALVQLGQKELLIETQGNWGNILTGDRAAAPRYIEARLSKLANDVVFNPKTTEWKLSYDGRNKEPITLPIKFPLLLAQGVEGIAVGLASKILPHNFNELIDASIACLKNEDFEILPDFPTGGSADCSKYSEGLRGGKVRVRAKIAQYDRRTLVISEIPFGTTTGSLIESIIAANEKGKIKVRKIDDNTAQNVEILIHLNPGVSPDQTIDALYAFTQCELSISPNACVIINDHPVFCSVKTILEQNTKNTLELLRRELQIRMSELEADWHASSLEKIFIENRIYHQIEACETWESVLETIDHELQPYKPMLHREVTTDDIIRLTEIKIKRISKYNSFKADEQIKGIKDEMVEVQNHLDHIIDYTINFYRQIKKKYGKGRDRKTEIRNFDTIQAVEVAANNEKLYVNRIEGFAGTSMKKDEFVSECSDIDEMIVFRENGTFMITKVTPKSFVGENVIHIAIFRKNDDRTIYNVVYRDGKTGPWFVKRFAVIGITRDKEYLITQGKPNSKIVYFSVNPNGEAESIKVLLRPKPKLKKLTFEYSFAELTIKGRGSRGNLLTKNPIKQIMKRDNGISTLGARDIWYDEIVKRLNSENRGIFVGAFMGDDKIVQFFANGEFKLSGYDMSTHFDDGLVQIQKYDPDTIFSVIYIDGETGFKYLKRFSIEESTPSNKRLSFIGEHTKSQLLEIVNDDFPLLLLEFETKNGKEVSDEEIDVDEFISVKSFRAKGKRLSTKEIAKYRFLEPLQKETLESTNKDDEDTENEYFVSEENQQIDENSTDKPQQFKSGDSPIQMELEF
ncbi:MAG: DNA gyrase/topoisomerase IV subunit A [Lentimicrobiaceae bacterium]|jgi:topoisomerase-4 subunit A|nr:DNA gyrase/topoisomerase IV subunit A [Lentimicrobiaceae bacterium]